MRTLPSGPRGWQLAVLRKRLETNETLLRAHLIATPEDANGRESLYVQRYAMADKYLALGGTLGDVL